MCCVLCVVCFVFCVLSVLCAVCALRFVCSCVHSRQHINTRTAHTQHTHSTRTAHTQHTHWQGNIYYQQRKYPAAIKMYRMALDQIPNTGKETRFKIMRNIGNAFVRLGQFQDAIQS